MEFRTLVALALTTLFSLVGCRSEDSADVNQDSIYTGYELFYNQNDDVTHAIARFRFGGPLGTVLELTQDSGAQVTFNGDNLNYSGFWGAHHREYAGNLTQGTFVYTNTEGATFTNHVPTGSSIGFPDGFTTINKSQSQTLTWEGTALATNDHVGVFVGSWAWGDDALFYVTGFGTTELVMGVNQLSNLPVGTSVVYMDRWNEENVMEGTPEGGKIRYKYRGTNATVNVEE